MLPLTQPAPCACLEVPCSVADDQCGQSEVARRSSAVDGYSTAADRTDADAGDRTPAVAPASSRWSEEEEEEEEAPRTADDAGPPCDAVRRQQLHRGGGDSDSPYRRGRTTSAPCRFERDRGRCHFERLPAELTTRIFGFLSPVGDALPLLARVNRRWRKILQDTPSLWRTIRVRCDQHSPRHCTVLSVIFRVYGDHVRELTWQAGSRVYESLFCLIPGLTSLAVLRLPIQWNGWVVDQLAPLARLEDVQIDGGFGLGDADLARAASHWPGLRRVVLNSCWAVTAKGVAAFLDSLPRLEECRLQVNEGLPLCDTRSDFAMLQGGLLARCLGEPLTGAVDTITVLSLNFVPVEMEDVWSLVNRLPRLRKLSISNCEGLQGVRLHSPSLQKIHLLNLWSVHFVSISAPSLRSLCVDSGLESNERLEVCAALLRTLRVDGGGVLRSLTARCGRLATAELRGCSALDPRCLHGFFLDNPFLTELLLGCVCEADGDADGGGGGDELSLDSAACPSLERVCLQADFSCRALLLRCPGLRVLQTVGDAELPALRQVVVVADRLQRVSLVGLPGLASVVVQCDSADCIEASLGDGRGGPGGHAAGGHGRPMCLRSFVVQASRRVGLVRLFDCSIGALMLGTPCARTVVLYRCQISDYALRMALRACPNIAHLGVERCDTLTGVCVPAGASCLRYLNLFGCKNLLRVAIECQGVAAVNLGQCAKARLFVRGIEYDLGMHPLASHPKIVLPHQSLRWSHDRVPQLFINAM